MLVTVPCDIILGETGCRLNEEREEGREECKIELVEEMVKKNLDVDLIMQITKLTEQQIKEIEKNMEISV